ncbi:e1-E2 ATPase domain-containing protein [Ditylenchus destructor]|uniref:E1-E2 ATPase domain-containing protein n=1 Tax=Ditylenchus destructor TaxID=166010 RepID=A0AAD4MTJ0_9BILA|nr:e1-E2 ATPase domain-containing protein [Ditylenchus destructor]
MSPKDSSDSGCCLSWPFGRRKKVQPLIDESKTRDLAGSFSEHTWDLELLSRNHPDSNINLENPILSGGLSSKKAEDLLMRNGPNCLPPPKEISNLRLFLQQFLNLLWVLLIFAATLSLLEFILMTKEVVHLWISLILYGMIIVMCTTSWYQEMQARKVVRGFQGLLPENCQVIRDGHEQSIPAYNLVVGDIIRIKNGSRVPADARIIACPQLKLEASSITGESEPVEYQTEEVREGTSLFDGRNVAFNGALCVDGEGIGVVIRVASQTVIGQIADMTTGQSKKKSRLEMQVRRYVIFLVYLVCTVSTTVFLAGAIIRKWKNPIGLLTHGFLVIAVGMIPAGLPATVTSLLTVVSRRLAKKNVYLKRLDVCEALGQVGIIASDKTGTLTKNIMTVTDLWAYSDYYVSGYPHSKPTESAKQKSVENYESPVSDMLTVMTVCNAAIYMDGVKTKQNGLALERHSNIEQGALEEVEERKPTGSPSEIAMLQYCDSIIDVDKLRRSHNIVFEIPFNSRRKWHLMIAKTRSVGTDKHMYKLMIKGASEILATKCSHIINSSGQTVAFDEMATKKFEKAYNVFAESGRRVIGFAHTNFVADSDIQFDADEENFPLKDLTFLGICAIMDPPKDETANAIKQCYKAGIKVFMVTGDHHLTATAIAKQIGLIDDHRGSGYGTKCAKNYEVLHGEQINQLRDKDWDRILRLKSLVFARTTPEQKLMIVEQCQKRKHLIAMTGDGVNDSPALKKADIGIAMGSGSEVAKQASDIILMDDNFSSIVVGVQEGRLMYENIKKLLGYNMPHNFAEAWPIIINFCFGMPMGITPLQILSIDLCTEIFPGVSMAKEPIEGDVMNRPPRRISKGLISNTLLAYSYIFPGQLQCLGCFLAYLYVFHSHGIGLKDLWMSALDNFHKSADLYYSNGKIFTLQEQMYISRQACSAWHMGVVFGQFFNVLSARTRRMSIFKHGLFANRAMIFSMIMELLLLCAFIYTPGVNTFMGGAPIPLECWGIVAGMGLFILFYNEMRKLYIRRFPRSTLTRYIKW